MTCGDDKIITAAINMSKGGAGRHKAYFINLHMGGDGCKVPKQVFNCLNCRETLCFDFFSPSFMFLKISRLQRKLVMVLKRESFIDDGKFKSIATSLLC
jgi:hypothetical protein